MLSKSTRKKISVSITTYNEEDNIERLLKNIKDFADEIILVDGQSKDRTVKIAEKYTKKIFVVPNNLNLNENKQIGLDKCTGDWILYMDADEIIEEELKEEIKRIINSDTEFNGFYMPRKAFVFGKWIRYGGHYPDYQLRLFKRGSGRFKLTSVHDFLHVDGEVGHLKNAILHVNYFKSIHQYAIKGNIYTSNDAIQYFKNKNRSKASKLAVVYMPLLIFCYTYFYKQGFRDGFYGFVITVIHTYSAFLLAAKMIELTEKMSKQEREAFIRNFK